MSPNQFYTPERLARTGAKCACGNVAVDYHNGFRCARCKRIEDLGELKSSLSAYQRQRREKLSQGYTEYHIAGTFV